MVGSRTRADVGQRWIRAVDLRPASGLASTFMATAATSTNRRIAEGVLYRPADPDHGRHAIGLDKLHDHRVVGAVGLTGGQLGYLAPGIPLLDSGDLGPGPVLAIPVGPLLAGR
jgi:hypothetical protein